MKQARGEETAASADPVGVRWKHIGQRIGAVAIAALPLVAAFTALYIGPWLMEEPWLSRARDAHAAWADTARVPGGRVLGAKNYLSGLRRLGPVPYLPDLTAAQFHIGQVSHVAPAGDRPAAFHVGYVGDEGCRISLWIAQTREAGSGALVSHSGGGAFSWYADGLRYVLVTADVQNNLFHLIAKISREITVARQAPSGSRRTALGLSVIMGQPCRIGRRL